MKKILVIDDADFILDSTSTLLEFEGYDVVTAKDGEEGLEKANSILPDLIFCDISMPKMSGYEVLTQIRNNDKTKRIPFIFLTAFNDKSNMREGMEKGADDYLVKPFTRDELISALLTQKKKYSIQEEHLQSRIQELGKNVSYALPHEFRTGINQIKGASGILFNDTEYLNQDDIKNLASDIKDSVERLSNIVENYLFYIKIMSWESDKSSLLEVKSGITEEPFAVSYDVFTNNAMKYNRIDKLKITGDLFNFSIRMSSENFVKVLFELIDNAHKFSSNDTEIKINAWLENDFLFFSIEDEGIGLSDNQIKNIAALNQFDRTRNEQQGVGLGLIIAKRLIELHDGEFVIKSETGKGTKVIFSIKCITN